MSEELKPCPFCGARDGRLEQAFTRATDDFAFWSVECLDCGCEIADDASQAAADAAWNTRPEPDARELAKCIERAIVDICTIGAGEAKVDAETGLLCVTADLDMYGIALRVLSPPLLVEIDRLNQQVLG